MADTTSDLELHLKLDQTAAGTDADDSSTNDFTCTLAGGLNFTDSVPGKFSNALLFNGTSDHITLPDVADDDALDFTLNDDFTLVGTFNASSFATNPTIFKRGTNNSALTEASYILYLTTDGALKFAMGDGSSGNVAVTLSYNLLVDTTYTVAARVTSNLMELFVNGNKDTNSATGTKTWPGGETLIQLAGAGTLFNWEMAGWLDDLRIYSRALADADIVAAQNPYTKSTPKISVSIGISL